MGDIADMDYEAFMPACADEMNDTPHWNALKCTKRRGRPTAQEVFKGYCKEGTEDKSPYITVYCPMAGYKAIMYAWFEDEDGGMWDVAQTGLCGYKTQREAIKEATEWAKADGIRYEGPALYAFKDYCKENKMALKDRQINVSISRTLNMGNYNSLKVTAGIGGCVEDDADLATEYKTLWNTANTEINRAITAFDKEKK